MKTTFKGVAIALTLAAALAGCSSNRPNEPTTNNGDNPGVPFVIDPATGETVDPVDGSAVGTPGTPTNTVIDPATGAVVPTPVQPNPVNPATGTGNLPSVGGGGGGTLTPNQTDSDGDGTPDANDRTPNEADSDGDGIPDSVDTTFGPPAGSASPGPGLPTVF